MRKFIVLPAIAVVVCAGGAQADDLLPKECATLAAQLLPAIPGIGIGGISYEKESKVVAAVKIVGGYTSVPAAARELNSDRLFLTFNQIADIERFESSGDDEGARRVLSENMIQFTTDAAIVNIDYTGGVRGGALDGTISFHCVWAPGGKIYVGGGRRTK